MDLQILFKLVVHPKSGANVLVNSSFDEDDGDSDQESRLDQISGLAIILNYRDSKGSVSNRLVTCRNLSVRSGVSYISAYCHARKALRAFRVDRISEVIDPDSGECLGCGEDYFRKFSPDNIAKSGFSWGLSPKRRADLVALLTSLIFVARCDQEYHPFERDVLEEILARFWIRLELPDAPDFDDIIAYADRLAPDGEAFWLSVQRLGASAELAALLRSALRDVIEADGVQHASEFYWVQEVEELLLQC